jgi:diguanylate cyclase (GGDEF)-like protein
VRYGGEEFLVVLDVGGNTNDRGDLVAVGDRIRERVAALDLSETGAGLKVTVSIGIATADAGKPLAEAIARADTALYEAKESGRNRCVVAHDVLL